MAEDVAEAETRLRGTGEATLPNLLLMESIDTCLERTRADHPADEDLAVEKEEGGLARGERKVGSDPEGTEEILKDIES